MTKAERSVVKARSPPALLPFNNHITGQTTLKWSIRLISILDKAAKDDHIILFAIYYPDSHTLSLPVLISFLTKSLVVEMHPPLPLPELVHPWVEGVRAPSKRKKETTFVLQF